MFEKILIANRGEIACRVFRTAKRLGMRTIAVYSDADANALHVRQADEAVHIVPAPSSQSYIVIEKILEAIKKTGADAVHPGYGFLAENAEFARRVIDEGLTWIGPPPRAIDALGDKVTARRIAEEVDAPLVPGTKDPVDSADDVVAFADNHGLPVAIKAAYGGGGRDMKVARTRGEIRELFESATREAVAASSLPSMCRATQWSRKVRAAMTSVETSARVKRVFWKALIGLPKAVRSLV